MNYIYSGMIDAESNIQRLAEYHSDRIGSDREKTCDFYPLTAPLNWLCEMAKARRTSSERRFSSSFYCMIVQKWRASN